MGSAALITEDAGAMRDAMPDGGVLLALDLGTKTIGTAFCDAGWQFSSAAKTLPRGKFGKDAEKLRAALQSAWETSRKEALKAGEDAQVASAGVAAL